MGASSPTDIGRCLTRLCADYFINIPATPLEHTSKFFNQPVYLKREDLIPGNLTGGGKQRKLNGLSAWLHSQKLVPKRITSWGSRYSNFLFELALWNNAQPNPAELLLYYLDRQRPQPRNHRPSWLDTFGIKATPLPIQQYSLLHRKSSKDRRHIVIPESGLHPGCLWGAFAAGADFYQAVVDQNITEIFTDAGWGVSAAGLYYFLKACGLKANVRVVVMTNPKDVQWTFEYARRYYSMVLGQLGAQRGDGLLKEAAGHVYRARAPREMFLAPATARSFGAVNAQVAAVLGEAAQTLGIMVEPVYSAKLLLTARLCWGHRVGDGGRAVVLSGGPLGLAGFREILATYGST